MSVWTATSSVASGRVATVSVASSRKSTAEESYITDLVGIIIIPRCF